MSRSPPSSPPSTSQAALSLARLVISRVTTLWAVSAVWAVPPSTMGTAPFAPPPPPRPPSPRHYGPGPSPWAVSPLQYGQRPPCLMGTAQSLPALHYGHHGQCPPPSAACSNPPSFQAAPPAVQAVTHVIAHPPTSTCLLSFWIFRSSCMCQHLRQAA